MSYTLRLTNGQILLTLADQQSDNVSTSLTLIGKNVNAYGADLNDNFIRLMENFSYSSPPTSPLVGQLWFNSLEQRMYFYNNSLQFKPVGGPILSATRPTNLVSGDLWIDTTKQQLNFYDGVNLITAGPAYDATLGKSGIIVETVTDAASTPHTVGGIYSNGKLLGVLSSATFVLRADSNYTTATGLTQVYDGITAAPGVKFYGTATNTESFNGIRSQDIIVSTVGSSQSLQSPLGIYNDNGITIGAQEDLAIYVTGTNRVVVMALADQQDFNLVGQTGSNPNVNILYYSSSTGSLGIFNTSPTTAVDIVGDVKVAGNLTVVGTATYIQTVNLQVRNKVIDLAYTSTTDTFSDLGGIVLHGTTNKSIIWQNSNQSWNISENINLPTGKSFKIGGVDVLTGSSLGAGITSAPGITTLTGLNTVTVAPIIITSSGIGVTNNVPLSIGIGPTAYIDFNGRKLTNAYTATVYDSANVVANKGYVDSAVATARAGQFTINIDVTGQASSPTDPNLDLFVINLLGYMLPPNDPSPYGIPDGARARVLATRYQTSSTQAVSDSIVFNPVTILGQQVVQYQSGYVVNTTVPSGALVTNRCIKQYVVSGGTWTPYNYTATNVVYSDGTW